MNSKELMKIGKEIHNHAVNVRFWENPPTINTILTLFNCELCKAFEKYLIGEPAYYILGNKPDGWVCELADCILRVLDYMEANRDSKKLFALYDDVGNKKFYIPNMKNAIMTAQGYVTQTWYEFTNNSYEYLIDLIIFLEMVVRNNAELDIWDVVYRRLKYITSNYYEYAKELLMEV